MVAGAPAILGAWIGGFAPSATLTVLFLGVGTGAILQVAYEIGKMVRRDVSTERSLSVLAFAGVVSGMLALWVTGLLVK